MTRLNGITLQEEPVAEDMIRVIIVEDHEMVRAGLLRLLSDMEDFEVVAETGEGQKALPLVETQRPDVVLLDITLPGMDGLEVLSQISRNAPESKVLILTMHNSPEFVAQALRNGASGYLLKEAATAELEIAIRAVARGENYLSPAVSNYIVKDYLDRVGSSASPLDKLTNRQREVFDLVVRGHTTKEIACRLKLSVKTVETHRQQLMQRLGIFEVTGLTRLAIHHGVLKTDDLK